MGDYLTGNIRERGGIGRRARFRSLCPIRTWRFDSSRSHSFINKDLRKYFSVKTLHVFMPSGENSGEKIQRLSIFVDFFEKK